MITYYHSIYKLKYVENRRLARFSLIRCRGDIFWFTILVARVHPRSYLFDERCGIFGGEQV